MQEIFILVHYPEQHAPFDCEVVRFKVPDYIMRVALYDAIDEQREIMRDSGCSSVQEMMLAVYQHVAHEFGGTFEFIDVGYGISVYDDDLYETNDEEEEE